MIRIAAFLGAFLSLTVQAAWASSASGWVEDGATAIRIVSGRAAEPDGSVIMGVEIRLSPGWKTYWREPGEAGVPPRFEWSGSDNIQNVEVLFPAPKRFEEQGGLSVGYDASVILPIRVTPTDRDKAVRLDLTLDYAVCEKLCVPAHGEVAFERSPDAAVDRFMSAGLEKSLKAVPQSAAVNAGLTTSLTQVEGGYLVAVEAGKRKVDLFAYSKGDWSPPVPKIRGSDEAGRSLFFVKTAKAPPGTQLSLVLVSGEEGAVEIPLDVVAAKP